MERRIQPSARIVNKTNDVIEGQQFGAVIATDARSGTKVAYLVPFTVPPTSVISLR